MNMVLLHLIHKRPRPWDLTCKNELFKPKEGYGEADGLHPNSKGHEKIYPKIFEFIKTIII